MSMSSKGVCSGQAVLCDSITAVTLLLFDGQLTPGEAVEEFTGPVYLRFYCRCNDEVVFQHRMSLLV